MLTGGLQQPLSSFECRPIGAGTHLRWVRFQVVHFLNRSGLNPHDQLEAGIANRQEPRCAPAFCPEGIRTTVGALNDRRTDDLRTDDRRSGDRGIVPGHLSLQICPQTPPLERGRRLHAHDLKQSGRQVQMTHRRSWNFHRSLSWNTDQERDTNNFLTQPHRRVIAPAVFEELLTVICGQRKHTIVPNIRLPQTVHQSGDLTVRPPNARVVQLDNLIPFSAQGRRRQIRTVPVFVQVASAARLDISSCQFAIRLIGWVVGRMRIHQMKPEKKWTLPNRRQPRLRLTYQNARGGKSSQGVDALGGGRNLHAVLKVQFVVDPAESERSRKTFYRSIELPTSGIAGRGFRPDGVLRCVRLEVKKIAENLESLVVTEALRNVWITRGKRASGMARFTQYSCERAFAGGKPDHIPAQRQRHARGKNRRKRII